MKEILNIFFKYFKEKPGFVLSNVAFSSLIPIQDVLLPHLYGKVISAIEKKRELIKPFVIVIILLAILQIGYVLSDWHDTKLFPDLQAYIRKVMLEKVFNNFETEYQDLHLGDLLSKFIKIPTHLTQSFERIKNYIIPYVVSYVIAAIYFLYNDIPLGIGLSILISFYIYFLIGAPIQCVDSAVHKDSVENILHEEIDDTLRNIISVYGSNQKDEEVSRLDGYEKNYSKAYKQTMSCALKTRAYMTPIIVGFLIVFLVRCNFLFKNKNLSTGKFVPLFIILLYLLGSMLSLTDQIRDIIFEVGVVSNFEDMFSHKSQIISKNPTIINNLPGLYLDNVAFSYSNLMHPIIENLTLYIKPNQKVSIIGDIGSGKSTILKLLLKLQLSSQGEIYFNGQPYSSLSVKEIRRRIGYVPQQPILFNRSILENIKYGNKNVSDEDINILVNKLALDKEFSYLENGLNSKIGKNGSKISGGQRQLIWCLRVLLSNPEILILDEPTASLDEKTKNLMKNLFDVFMNGRTVIMVTHDPTLMQYADRTITLKKGKIISDVLSNKNGEFNKYF